jgi:hypothetical protein
MPDLAKISSDLVSNLYTIAQSCQFVNNNADPASLMDFVEGGRQVGGMS